jgi:hypothetical protein
MHSGLKAGVNDRRLSLPLYQWIEVPMSFTEEEKRAWHEEKRRREHRPDPVWVEPPAAICIHCQRPFGFSEGMIGSEIALCDTCNGD